MKPPRRQKNNCDETTLTSAARSTPYSLSIPALSKDDLYLTNAQRTVLTVSNSGNPPLRHRGVLRAHDLHFAHSVFAAWRNVLEVSLPVYAKSAFSSTAILRWYEYTAPRWGAVPCWCVAFLALSADVVGTRDMTLTVSSESILLRT